MIEEKDVTIIIPTLLDSSEEVKRALREHLTSLQETAPKIKKILAVNSYKHQGVDLPGVENLELMFLERQGQCGAVNAAVATTNTPYVFITNDDMVYPPGWFEKLVAPLEVQFQAGRLCVSAKLIEPRPGAPTFEVCFCGGAGGDFDKQKFLDFASTYKGDGLRTGLNFPLFISRELWDLVGGYDVNYDVWGSNSDSDLEYKIRLAGVQPMQNTDCIVYHFSQTSGTFSPAHQDAWNRNWQYFIDKWGFPRTDTGIWEANFEIPNEGRRFRPEWEGKYGNVN